MWFSNYSPQQKYYSAVMGWVLFIGLLLSAVACTTAPVEEPCDICVDERIELFYESNGGDDIFGKPHTRPLLDRSTDRLVQYFDGMRIEFDGNNPDDVVIADLGAWALEGLDEPIEAVVPDGAPSRVFENGYEVQGAFLEFYETNNGEQLFGQPLTNQLNEGHLRVQYFENVRLEWHPDAPDGRKVQVGFLGRAHYLYEAYDPTENLIAVTTNEVQVTDVNVTAAVSSPTLYGEDEQIIFILVESVDKQPVEGVQVQLTITDGDETYSQTLEEMTNPQGLTQGTVEARGWEPSEDIRVSVSVNYPGQGTIGKTLITFRKWWSD